MGNMEQPGQINHSEEIGQKIFSRIEAVKGDIREKLFEANSILAEILAKPKEDVSKERFISETVVKKLIEFYELELKQEELDIERARRSVELTRRGIPIPAYQNGTAKDGVLNMLANDEKYRVDNNKRAA